MNESRLSNARHVLDDNLALLREQIERTHRSGERAGAEGVKVLVTLQAGLGVTIGTWLQHLLELPSRSLHNSLAGYLVHALFVDIIGLVLVAAIPLLDMQSADAAGKSSVKQVARVIGAKLRTAPITEDEKLLDQALVCEITAHDSHHGRINAASKILQVLGLILLAAALGFILYGVHEAVDA